MMHLSMAENLNSILYVLYFMLNKNEVWWTTLIYVISVGGTFIWLILTMLTIDCFLTVYYSIHCIIIWSIQNTKLVLVLCFVGSVTASIYFAIYLQDLKEASTFFSSYIWLPFDFIFIMISISTYIYIYCRICKQRN